jgi:hypothetical protein
MADDGSGAPETKLNSFQGIWSSVDPYSRAPKGGFRVADNVIFKNPGLVEPRRGFASFLSAATYQPLALFTGLRNSLGFGITWHADRSFRSYIWQNQDPLNPVVNNQATPFSPGTSEFDGFVPYPYSIASRVRFAQADKNTYAITAYGLAKSEDNLTWRLCQLPVFGMENPNAQGYGTRATVVDKGTYNWLPYNYNSTGVGSQVAYKLRFARKGTNNDYVFGQPSAPIICQNPFSTGADRAVRVIPVMGELGTSDGFVEVYRTRTVSVSQPLPQDFYKVAEIAVPVIRSGDGYVGCPKTIAEVVSNSLYYEDILVDQGLGPPLETNPTDGDTDAVGYAPCPSALDIAWFKNRMYVANYIDVERMVLPLTGTGTTGVVAGDTITIDGIVYTWQNASGFDYKKPVVLTGAGSVYLNLLATANSLTGCINYGYADAWNQKYVAGYTAAGPLPPMNPYQIIKATYIGDTSQPGSLLLERLVPGADQFTVTYDSTGAAYGVVSGKQSDHNVQVAGLRYTEEGQPESFPIANDLTIGDPGLAILRIVGTRDSLWIFKEDGLYRLVDDGNGPSVSIFDPTIRLMAPDSVVALNNEIYALCSQGVLRINEQGKDVMSTAIQRELLELIAETAGSDAVRSLCYGTAYESEGQYILSIPPAVNSPANTVHYVYHIDSKSWSTYSFRAGLLAAAVDPQWDTLMLAMSDKKVWQERKAFVSEDHSDVNFSLTIPPAIVGTAATEITFTSNPGLKVGDFIYQDTGGYYYGSWVREVSDDLLTVTLYDAPTHNWANIALQVRPGIPSTLQFLPIVGPDELMAKTYDEHIRLAFLYFDHPFYDAQVATDEVPVPEDIDNGRVPEAVRWGTDMGTWGSTLWGEDSTNVVSRVTFSDEHARAAEFDLTLMFSAAGRRFELASIALGNRGSMTPRVVL